MPRIALLREIVIGKIMHDLSLQKMLRTHVIVCDTRKIDVSDGLLDHSVSHHDLQCCRKAPLGHKTKHHVSMEKKERIIGGSIIHCSACEGAFWVPPSGAHLFRLQGPGLSFNGHRYYLLVCQDRTHIIHQCFGKKNTLSLIGEGEYSYFLGTALQSIIKLQM